MAGRSDYQIPEKPRPKPEIQVRPDEHMTIMTRNTSLIDLCEANDPLAWTEFLHRYGEMLVSFARQVGLSDREASDVAKATILAFGDALRDHNDIAEQSRVRIKQLLRDIARKRVLAVSRHDSSDGSSSARVWIGQAHIGNSVREEAMFDLEWQRACLRRAMDMVRAEVGDQTMSAFEQYVLRRQPVGEVAQDLNTTPTEVYVAKTRVLRRIQASLVVIQAEE